MPYVNIKTAESLDDAVETDLMREISSAVSEVTGKGEQYIMVSMERAKMIFAGETGKCAFVQLNSIGGLNPNVNKILSQKICDILNRLLQIPHKSTYISFIDVEGSNWGWNGSTFA